MEDNALREYDGFLLLQRRSSLEGEKIVLSFIEKISGQIACRAELSLVDFADALTRHGHLPCVLSVDSSGKLGMRLQVRTQRLTIPWGDGRSLDESIEEVVRPWEREGWLARRQDFHNPYRLVDETEESRTFLVTFERFVEPEDW